MRINLKGQILEAVEATRQNNKQGSVAGYLQQFEKELRYRDLHRTADELKSAIAEKMAEGGLVR